MAQDETKPGTDLTKGIALSALAEGKPVVGHVGEEEVLLVRRGADAFAIGAHCTHYHGPLGDGLVLGDTVRCPWHHACFDLKSGRVQRPPAISDLPCWVVEKRADDMIFVREKKQGLQAKATGAASSPGRMVIVGGGAAGFSAADTLRREQYQGSIVLLSGDAAAPVDRPNLSKDYLAGNAPEDWVPLRPDSYYAENGIELQLNVTVSGVDVRSREVLLADGRKVLYDRLLLTTGAEPIRLSIPGAELPHVFTLRSLADCQAIIARADKARKAVVIGASFIGLEVAASLRARKIEVQVVAPERRPMERILGAQMGDFVRNLHQEHGVIFHLEDTAVAIESNRVRLKRGGALDADFVVAGIGVRPCLALAKMAGLALDRGVAVDDYLETNAANIFAAGDIARWPDPHTGENIRVEHWVVAERQGQTAARNMLGYREKFTAVPFFWSQHYDIPINYVGHAEVWDDLTIEGDIQAKDCLLRYKRNGRLLAVASIFRDVDSLQAEVAMEREVASLHF
jgi:apoptosis-inducing factor 3